MHQPTSFLRTWRKKGRPQTCPPQGSALVVELPIPPRSSNSSPVSPRAASERRPSDSPSEGSTRSILRIFRGNRLETDASSLASFESPQKAPELISPLRPPPRSSRSYPPSPEARSSPLVSHSFDRPLPPVPPVRPPRPPSLNLDTVELTTPRHPARAAKRSRTSQQRPPLPEHSPRRKMPELDNVWEGFIKDVEGDDSDFMPSSSLRGVPHHRANASSPSLVDSQRRKQPAIGSHRAPDARPKLYRAGGSESTPYLSSYPTSDADSESSTDEGCQNDAGFSLSLFPVPPPLLVRRRGTPKPLVLLPTPSIAPLPPSPAYNSSGESTPVATPTTPKYVDPSHSSRSSAFPSPPSILKKPGSFSAARARGPSPPSSPSTPTSAVVEAPSAPPPLPPRLRTARSVPHLQPLVNTHRNTSSDTTSTDQRRRVASRPDVYSAQQSRLPRRTVMPPTNNVEWGYAL